MASKYEQLVKALRECASDDPDCIYNCPYYNHDVCADDLKSDAAAAIEDMAKHITEMHERVTVLQIARGELEAEVKRIEPKRGELTADEIETIRIHMNAIKERLCNQNRHNEAEEYQVIVDKLAKMMEVQE